MEPRTKVCTGCKTEKPLKDFPKNSELRDGRQNKCKACYKAEFDKKKADEKDYAKKYFTF